MRIDNFVTCEANQLAKDVLANLADAMEALSWPVVIHGKGCTGKTALLQGTAARMANEHPDANIKYVSAQNFVIGYVDALRNCALKQFFDQYAKLDALFFDDVQELEGKESFQEALFNIFNSLYVKNKPIIMSCNQHPTQLKQMDQNLQDRLRWGMVIEVGPLDGPSKEKLLDFTVEEFQLSPKEKQALKVLYPLFIEKAEDDLRALIGYIKRIVTFAELLEETITEEFALKVSGL